MASLVNEAIWFCGRGDHSSDPLDKFIFYLSSLNAITHHISGTGRGEYAIEKTVAAMGGDTVKMLREPLVVICDRKRLEIRGSDCQEKCLMLLGKGSIDCLAEALMIIQEIRGLVFHPPRSGIQPVSYEILIACNEILKEVASFLIGTAKNQT